MATNNAINSPKPFSTTDGGTGISNPTGHAILVGAGSSALTQLTLTNGQMLIGSTAADPVATTLTGGSGITITNGAGSITISSTGNDTWTTVTGVSQAMAVNNGYVANNIALVTLTLPSTAIVGDKIEVDGLGSGGFTIAQNAGQLIHLGSQVTTIGVAGSISSTNQYDNLRLRCIVINTTWTVEGPVGNFTIV